MSVRYTYESGFGQTFVAGADCAPGDITKARKAFLRALPRKFPPFQRGMLTARYIERYRDANPIMKPADLRGAAHVLPYNLDAYRRAAPVPLPDEPDERYCDSAVVAL